MRNSFVNRSSDRKVHSSHQAWQEVKTTSVSSTKAGITPGNEVVQEIRFAVVMYGGVSLAIYINGVAQELRRLVAATAGAGGGNVLPQGKLAYQGPSTY